MASFFIDNNASVIRMIPSYDLHPTSTCAEYYNAYITNTVLCKKYCPLDVCACVSSIMAMHPKGMGRYYTLADTSYYTTFSPVAPWTMQVA